MIKQVTIIRDPKWTLAGVFGNLYAPNGRTFVSGELPWTDRDDDGKRDAGESCIAPKPGDPAKTYLCEWTKSPSRKNKDGSAQWTYRLRDVPNAAGILMHPGNFVGDVTQGYLADAKGCILIGMSVADILIPKKRLLGTRIKQLGVTSSRDAVKSFVEIMKKESFELTISWKEA